MAHDPRLRPAQRCDRGTTFHNELITELLRVAGTKQSLTMAYSGTMCRRHNEQEFIVESIIAHRGSRNRRSSLQFKVRWAGFGETCDSWEPNKSLMHVGKLHDYLRANTMKTLIPKEHK